MADPFYYKCLKCNEESGPVFYGGLARAALRELASPDIAKAIATLINHQSAAGRLLDFDVRLTSGVRSDGQEYEGIQFIAGHAGHRLAVVRFGGSVEEELEYSSCATQWA